MVESPSWPASASGVRVSESESVSAERCMAGPPEGSRSRPLLEWGKCRRRSAGTEKKPASPARVLGAGGRVLAQGVARWVAGYGSYLMATPISLLPVSVSTERPHHGPET